MYPLEYWHTQAKTYLTNASLTHPRFQIIFPSLIPSAEGWRFQKWDWWRLLTLKANFINLNRIRSWRNVLHVLSRKWLQDLGFTNFVRGAFPVFIMHTINSIYEVDLLHSYIPKQAIIETGAQHNGLEKERALWARDKEVWVDVGVWRLKLEVRVDLHWGWQVESSFLGDYPLLADDDPWEHWSWVLL